MKLIKTYLQKIVNKNLTHSQIIVIAYAIEEQMKWHKIEQIAFFAPVLRQHGLTIVQRKATARLMLEVIEELELATKPMSI